MDGSESDSVERKRLQNVLLQLPVHLLELICQLLIDNAERVGDRLHFRALLDVMRLRASCSILNDVIKSMILFMPCYVTDQWTKYLRDRNFCTFIKFMKKATNWQFRSVEFQAEILEKRCDILPFCKQNEKLFQNSLRDVKVCLNMPVEHRTLENDLFRWLKSVALKSGAKVEGNCFFA